MDPWTLFAVNQVAQSSKSSALALSFVLKNTDVAEAVDIARLDEQYQ